MEHIPYKYGIASPEARSLIVGKQEDVNPLAHRRTNLLPVNKLRINESITVNKDEVKHYIPALLKSTVLRYNREYADCLRIVETVRAIEIVRIR